LGLPGDSKSFAPQNGQRRDEKLFMEKLINILDFVFGCHHGHLSRVFTIDRRTYQVCCDCGAKFDYSLASMSSKRRIRAFDTQYLTIS
jgi:hypothetical protein